jgi:hypothetical protein
MCGILSFTEHFENADYVAIGKILKVYPNESDEEIYKADIQEVNLIKGQKISSIYVGGRSDGKIGSSCSIYTPEGKEYIFFGKKNKDGLIVFGECSGTRDLDYVKEKTSYILEALEILKNKSKDFTGHPPVVNFSALYPTLQEYKGIPMKEKFALFEVEFHEDLKVEKVKILKGFGSEVDQKIVTSLLQSTGWKIQYSKDKFTVPKGTKKLIGVYYYEADDENPSFLSENDL